MTKSARCFGWIAALAAAVVLSYLGWQYLGQPVAVARFEPAEFERQFDSASDRIRLVALLSPT